VDSIIVLVISVLVTFVVPGMALAAPLLRRIPQDSQDRAAVLLTAFGIAPGLIAVLLYFLFWLLPGMPAGAYIAILGVVLAVVPLTSLCIRRTSRTERELPATRAPEVAAVKLAKFTAVAIAILTVLIVLYTGTMFPIQTHDAMQHAYIGRMLAEDRSLEHVPLLEPLPDSFSLNIRYPPGLHLIYAWTYLFHNANLDTGVRSIAPIFLLLTVGLVWIWGNWIHPGTGPFAALMLAATPLLAEQAATNSIDPSRVFLFAAAFFWLHKTTKDRAAPCALGLASAGFVLAPFFHTLGVLGLPVGGLLHLLAGRRSLSGKLRQSLLLFGPAVALLAAEIGRRWVSTGRVFPALLYEPIPTSELLSWRGLSSIIDILARGVGGIFTSPRLYGVAAWFALLWLTIELFQRRRQQLAPAVFLAAAASGTAVLIWIAPIKPPGWANVRYILTIVPLLAILAGFAVREATAWWAQVVASARWSLLAVLLGVGAAATIAMGTLLTPVFVATHISSTGILLPDGVLKVQILRTLLFTAGGALAVLAFVGHVARRIVALVPVVVLVLFLSAPAYVGVIWNKGVSPTTGFALSEALLPEDAKLEDVVYGYVASTLFINTYTPKDAVILVTEESAYPYYGTRNGVFWRDLRLSALYDAKTVEQASEVLFDAGVTHLQVADRRTREALFTSSLLPEIIADATIVEPLWRHEGPIPTTVYRLIPSATER